MVHNNPYYLIHMKNSETDSNASLRASSRVYYEHKICDLYIID